MEDPKVPAHEMLLTNCQVIEPFINYPVGLAPGERPDGWGPDESGETLAAVSIHAYKCERIAIADYERGPIHLLLDLHSNAAIPPDCQAEPDQGVTDDRILRHLLTDDPEVGAYLQSTYGISVLLAKFAEADRAVAAGTFHDWSWSLDGGAPSVVSVFEPSMIDPYPTLRDRLFWQVGNGLGVLQLEYGGDGPNGELPSNGTIQPPLLLASETDGRFVGASLWLENAGAQGLFSRYADLECKEPLP